MVDSAICQEHPAAGTANGAKILFQLKVMKERRSMPTVNVFYQLQADAVQVDAISSAFKSYVAQELSCGSRQLSADEVSIRLIQVFGTGMIAALEVEVTAHAYPERIETQDEICLRIRSFLQDNVTVGDIKVWVLLPQLGHSWE